LLFLINAVHHLGIERALVRHLAVLESFLGLRVMPFISCLILLSLYIPLTTVCINILIGPLVEFNPSAPDMPLGLHSLRIVHYLLLSVDGSASIPAYSSRLGVMLVSNM
jgi:hypothetical protein